jgi:ATP/maltotriose-dependent transcriptional regulator MalT
VPRPRLLKRLDDGLHRRLTVISGPAGYGKSTLALQTAWQRGRRSQTLRMAGKLAAATRVCSPIAS